MNIDVGRSILIIAVCAACTFAERLFPFVIFRGREVPEVVRYLGKILPTAIIATLTVYCLRGASFGSIGGFAPALIAVAVTVALHLWKRNTLISVAGGTACFSSWTARRRRAFFPSICRPCTSVPLPSPATKASTARRAPAASCSGRSLPRSSRR